MKYLILLAAMFFSTPLLADSSFLSGLNFARVYEEKGDNQYNLISENGLSVENFMKKMNDPNTALGEKVALLNALSSYYEWKEKPKGSFILYQKKFVQSVKDTYKQEVSPQNEALKPEIRLLLQLLADYDTSSPHVEMYQILAKKMPNSLTAQSVSVFAYAYDILYNDKNEFANVQNFKNNYLEPYFRDLQNFEEDVPTEIKKTVIDDFLVYTFDCEGRLKCLVDTSTEKSTATGLNNLSENIKKNISSGTKISNSYGAEWVASKTQALKWISLQEKYIAQLKATDLQKAEMVYFFDSKLYELMHNIDYLSVRFWESSLLAEMNKSKPACKTDAKCAANSYFKKTESDLEKMGISKKDIELLNAAKNTFEAALKEKSDDFGIDAVAGTADSEPKYQFESSFDMLHFLMLYFYQHPEQISQMYDLK